MVINHIGILSAMPEEIGETISHLENVNKIKYGDLTLYQGYYSVKKEKLKITLAWSGWGKVSASRAITRLIACAKQTPPLDVVLFTGVAGAANNELNQWDFVIGEQLIQYDLDATPLFPKYVIPALNKSILICKEDLVNIGYLSAKKTISEIALLSKNIVKKGFIATGDKFVSDKETLRKIVDSLPKIDAIEMEGAAIAQVAIQENIPWLIVRTISDAADEDASQDFSEFLKKYRKLSWNFIKNFLELYKDLQS